MLVAEKVRFKQLLVLFDVVEGLLARSYWCWMCLWETCSCSEHLLKDLCFSMALEPGPRWPSKLGGAGWMAPGLGAGALVASWP